MKKIKNFKINLRLRETLRLLKTTAHINEITLQIEEAVKRERERVSSSFVPAAVYETVSKEKLPIELIVSAPEKWVAATVFVSTIGAGIEQDIRDAQSKNENIICQILHAVALDAIEQSGSFVYRLIIQEANDDDCEITRQQLINSPAMINKITGILPLDKIGVQILNNDSFQPMYTSAGIVYWIPLKKHAAKV